ncbi:MAG: sulfatase-like hydrolase/transferase [Planctomycetota bacterium]|nr:sulfatase-like hydrolase/transferase [Planctomycetota bacterium]
MSRPNLLLVMTDQQRADALGCAGGWVRTPNLDALAAEGVRFAHAVTTTPVCVPARVSLATGHYPHVTGVWNNRDYALPPEYPTWMQAVRAAGYRTSLFGKTHLHPHTGDLREREHLLRAYGLDDIDEIGGPRASMRCGSHMTDAWQRAGLWEAYRADFKERFAKKPWTVRPSPLGLEHYYDTYVGTQAARYLERYERKEPWCCWVSFGGPHEPWDTPEPFASMYDPAAMPKPAAAPADSAPRPQGELDLKLARKPALTPGDVAAMRANYAGNVTLIDEQIGRIFETIRKRGEWEKTVVVFTSDHGEHNGDAGLIYKSTFLDGPVRVPLIVRTPETAQGPRGGAVHEAPAEWIDAGATLVEAAGGTYARRQFAKSLLPAVHDGTIAHRADALSEISGETMLLTPEWKIAVNAEDRPYLLFDRRNDPAESKNLAGNPEFAEVEHELRLRLQERVRASQMR